VGQTSQSAGAVPEWTPPTWEEVVRQHSARVYRLAYRLTGNTHDAEDLTQEVFVRVFRSLSSYTPGTFEGWLHRITTNLFLDMARRKQRIRFEGLGDESAQWLSGGEPTPAQAFDDRHLDGDIQAALKALAPEYRAAVVLCDIEGLSYEEIAETLGVKLGTVRSRIHRGRAQLRAALGHRRPRRAGSASSVPATPEPASRVPASRVPASRVPASRVPASPASASSVPASPEPASSVAASPARASSVPASSVRASSVPATPASASPARASSGPATPASVSPLSASPVLESPVLESPVLESPVAAPLAGDQ
jgi:RNA polymerase sigma-70 factor (ECF subfamily)